MPRGFAGLLRAGLNVPASDLRTQGTAVADPTPVGEALLPGACAGIIDKAPCRSERPSDRLPVIINLAG
jgi:hypothetical protein